MTDKKASQIFLDANLSPRPLFRCWEEGIAFEREHWGCPSIPQQSSSYYLAVREALDRICTFVGANAEDRFIFTSSAAEGISQVFTSLFRLFMYQTGRNFIMLPRNAGAAIYQAAKALETFGCEIVWLDVNEQGQVSADAVYKGINPKCALLSMPWADPLLGVVHPVWEIADICKQHGVYFHVDATSVLGKNYFRFEDIPIDYLTFDGRLLGGPYNSGGLFIKDSAKIGPLIYGDEQGSLRGGNWSIGHLIAMSRVFDQLQAMQEYLCLEIPRLRDLLEDSLVERCSSAQVLYADSERLPNTTAIAFPGVHQEALLYYLHDSGIRASIGGGEQQTLSHQLNDPSLANSAISFSLPGDIDVAEINVAAEKISTCVKQLQNLSQGVLVVE